ncbi:MAG: Rpn family recombination-promoting nuclease/putative transposase [Burkholderiaceae bacterium]
MAFTKPLSSVDPCPSTTGLSLCNDLVFKILFSDHLPLLTDLINAVRYPAQPIAVRRVLNPTILPEDLAGKEIILDILAEDSNGQRLAIEMQLQRFLHWPERHVYGVARSLAAQLGAGQDYRLLKPSIGISLLVHDLFKDHADRGTWHFTLRDTLRPQIQLGQVLQVHIIELRKAEKQLWLPAPLQAWIACLLHNLDEAAMSEITHPPVKEALKHLETLYSNEELRLAAERRAQALIDAEDIVDCAYFEGKQEGIEEGLEQGLEQQQQTLLRMLERRFGSTPTQYQTKILEADAPHLQEWTLNMLDARRIEDVFA